MGKSIALAIYHCLDRKRLLIAFLGLIICGTFFVLCSALSYRVSSFLKVGLFVFPFLFSGFVSLFFSDIIIELYIAEKKGLKPDYKQMVFNGGTLVNLFTLCPIFLFLILWMVLGVYSLIRIIPQVGQGLSYILAFVPFIILISFFILTLFSIMMLFYLPPLLKAIPKKQLIHTMKKQVFSKQILSFFVVFVPIGFIGFVLYLIMGYSNTYFIKPVSLISEMVSSLFMMFPICFFLSPFFSFFYHFSYEMQLALSQDNRG